MSSKHETFVEDNRWVLGDSYMQNEPLSGENMAKHEVYCYFSVPLVRPPLL